MKTFADETGRTWEVAINVTAVKRLRAHLGLDLLAMVESEKMAGLADFLADPVRVADALYVLCLDQCKASTPPVSDEDFGRAMAGDAIVAGAAAIASELADFFPSPRVRAALRATIDAWARVDARANELASRHLATAGAAFEEKMGRVWATVERDLAAETSKALEMLGVEGANPTSTPTPNPNHPSPPPAPSPDTCGGSSGGSPASSASTPAP